MQKKEISNSKQPLSEVFGFPISNDSEEVKKSRQKRLCPFNRTSNICTKDKAESPLGVCSIYYSDKPVINCPIRFQEGDLIFRKAADFFFEQDEGWDILSEIRLKDKDGKTAGNIDYVLVLRDKNGKLIDFASLEIQSVYITGNLRKPFEKYIEQQNPAFEWNERYNYPKPDYLSSSRKRLIPQMLQKGGIFKNWKKKQAVALQKSFYETLPALPEVAANQADIAWFLYDLSFNEKIQRYDLKWQHTIYTRFEESLLRITTPLPGKIEDFVALLEKKLT